MDFITFKEKGREYLSPESWSLLEGAYSYCLAGSPSPQSLEASLSVASTLMESGLDPLSLIAAVFYKLPEDKSPVAEIEKQFGTEVSKLVNSLRRLSRISVATRSEAQAENLRKMLLAMAEDVRVVYIKLAGRLQEVRSIAFLDADVAKALAHETLDIYAPLAHRLGIWRMKWQLEDSAFAYLQPEEHNLVANLVKEKYGERESFINEIIQTLKQGLTKIGIRAEVSGRPKHVYSAYKKMQRYAEVGKSFGDIHDLMAIRIIVDSISDCYSALGIVHSLWHPLPGEFDDYIANPKENGYSSLHTTAMCEATPLEIQIRTQEMHRIAEYGLAAHWSYKEEKEKVYSDRIAWLRQLLEWQRELKGKEFLEAVKTDFFPDQVFVFTPKGEIKELPTGATPLDFAYSIHTSLGHRCLGAKVNGRLVPLNHQLKNGDTVEIIAAKGAKAPSRDWLNPNLGYVTTHHAKLHIRQWFKKQGREDNIRKGKEILEKEFRRLRLTLPDLGQLLSQFNRNSVDDLLASIGYGSLSARQIALKVAAQAGQPLAIPRPATVTSLGVQVLGVGDLLTRLGHCCHPVQGDPIIGFVTRCQGVTVHRQNCHNVLNEDEKERLIPVEWVTAGLVYPVNVLIKAWDRIGLLRDIAAVVAEDKVNIAATNSVDSKDNTRSIRLTLEIKDMEQLSRILAKIEGVKGVIRAVRSSG